MICDEKLQWLLASIRHLDAYFLHYTALILGRSRAASSLCDPTGAESFKVEKDYTLSKRRKIKNFLKKVKYDRRLKGLLDYYSQSSCMSTIRSNRNK